MRYKADGEWRDVTFAAGRRDRLRDRPRADRPRPRAGRARRASSANTRPEWTYADFAISLRRRASSCRSTRRTRPRSASGSPATPRRSASSARTPRRSRRSARSASACPHLRHIIVIDAGGDTADAIALDDAARARPRPRRAPSCERAHEAVDARGPLHVHLHVRHDRPAEGLRAHARQLPLDPRHGRASAACSRASDDVVYLFLPLAHAFALLIQLVRVRHRHDDRLLRRRPQADHPRAHARSSRPTCRRCRGSSRSSTRSPPASADPEQIAQVRAGRPAGPRRCEAAARTSRPSCRRALRRRPTSKALQATCAAVFGGRLREAVTGAAPIAPEILEFFWACGVPVMEGYGMTETATAATDLDARGPQVRHRRARRSPASRSRSPTTARSCIKGANIFQRLLQERRRVVRRRRRRLAAHRRPRLARRGRLPLDHRPQEGHHHHRGRQEPDAGEPRERPQAVALDLPGRDARRPPAVPGDAVTLDEEEIVPWAQQQGSTDRRSPRWRTSRRSIALIQDELDKANAKYAQVEQVKKFFDPRPRPLAGDRRADADAQGQAQRRQREVRRRFRRALRG